MRRSIWLLMIALQAGWTASALAAERWSLPVVYIQNYGPETPAPSAQDAQAVMDLGRDYLRTYLRENMLRLMADQGLRISDEAIALHWPAAEIPGTQGIETTLRMMAAEDVESYVNCGRFLPVRVEVESSYPLMPRLLVNARVCAPFNDSPEFSLGSSLSWDKNVNTRLECRLRDPRAPVSLTMGIGFAWEGWTLEMDSHLENGPFSAHRFSLNRQF